MNKISVVINTYNAEQYLEQVLESVSGFDEVLVCDMESTDTTLLIAERHGCRIVTFPKGLYNIVEPARDYAIHQASHEWVLVVDADEIVTADLREYLYRHVAQETSAADGIFLPRRNYFMGHFMHALYPDYILRFFRRDKTMWPPVIHTQPEVNGTVIHAPKHDGLAFEHLAANTISERLRKTDIYTDNECERKADKHYGAMALLLRPAHRFIKNYVFKCGFRDGKAGFIYACLEAYYQIVMMGKLIERKKTSYNT